MSDASTPDDKRMPVRISAITPVFNRRELTLDCLRTLYESDLDGIDLHCIVIDDGSNDGSSEAIRAGFPQVEVIAGDGTLWYSEGTNVGIRAALERDPDFLLLYNNDNRFPPGCLKRLVDCATRYPASLVGAVLINWDEPEKIFQVGTRWETAYGGWRTLYRQKIGDLPDGPFAVETIVGNCVLVPAQAIRQCGLMNSQALPNFGDAELTTRMRKAGWRLLIDPSARVLCQPNDLPRRLSSMAIPELYDALWKRRTSYHNLRQKAAANMGGAPTPVQGALATAAYLARLGLKFAGLAGRWPNDLTEAPLRDTIAPLHDPAAEAKGDGTLIIYAWPYTEWGGVQTYMMNLMKVARAAGFRTATLLPEATDSDRIDELRALGEVWLFDGAHDLNPATTLKRRMERRRTTAEADRALLEVLFARAPEHGLVHIDAGPWTSPTLLNAILDRYPTAMTIHTGLPVLPAWRRYLWRRNFASVMARPGFRLIAANADAYRSLAPYVAQEKRDDIAISPSSFDGERIEQALALARSGKEDFRTRLGLPAADFRIVVGAQLIPRKGYATLLDALRQLRAEGMEVACLWITPNTPPPQDRAVLDLDENKGLIDLRSAEAVGGTNLSYLATLAQLADCFVLPSLVEGLPLALIEAQALGVPCIATDINGVPEAISPGKTGLLVPAADQAALAAAIIVFAKDQTKRFDIGRAGRMEVMQRFALTRVGKSTLAIYADMKKIKG